MSNQKLNQKNLHLEKIKFVLEIQGKLIEKRVAIDLSKVSNKEIYKDIEKMIVNPNQYIQRENGKYLFLDKEKALKLLEIVDKKVPTISK